MVDRKLCPRQWSGLTSYWRNKGVSYQSLKYIEEPGQRCDRRRNSRRIVIICQTCQNRSQRGAQPSAFRTWEAWIGAKRLEGGFLAGFKVPSKILNDPTVYSVSGETASLSGRLNDEASLFYRRPIGADGNPQLFLQLHPQPPSSTEIYPPLPFKMFSVCGRFPS